MERYKGQCVTCIHKLPCKYRIQYNEAIDATDKVKLLASGKDYPFMVSDILITCKFYRSEQI